MKNLVNAYDVKLLTTIGATADNDKIEKVIADTQRGHLRPLLGGELLFELLAYVATAPEHPSLVGLNAQQQATAEATYKTDMDVWRTVNPGALGKLWDQVKAVLSQWVVVEGWHDLLVHIDAAGMLLKTGNAQGTTVADAATLREAKAVHRERAVGRGDELVAWLERNKADYPAYVSTNPAASGREPADWFGGISID